MATLAPANGIVTLTSDFGLCDPYVGVMKGAVLAAFRRAILIDVAHEIAPQDVRSGSFFAAALIDRFPPGTVHVVVVDPGVGTDRKALAVAARGCYWLAPDNGVLEPLLGSEDSAVLAIDLGALGIRPASCTFHGRDVFAPVAGRLAAGTLGFRSLGASLLDPIRLRQVAGARVVHIDRFGNLLTDLELPLDRPSPSRVVIAGRDIPVVRCYADVAPSQLLALRSSYGTLEIAVREGSAAQVLAVGTGTPVESH